MSKRKKRIEKLRRGAEFTPEELDTLLVNDLGCEGTQHGTSHKTYRHPDGRRLTIPQHKPHIKRFYVKKVAEIFGPELDAIAQGDDDE